MPSNAASGVITRFKDALEYTKLEDVTDRTSLWRTFDGLDPNVLRNCLQSMREELLDEHEHGGGFVVIDGTHIAAWQTRAIRSKVATSMA
jgi:hypothetical protein